MRRFLSAISRGAGWKLGSDIAGRLLQFALLWIAARKLGPDNFGDFSFALSVGYMLAQVADFGLQLFAQRELSRLAIPGAKSSPYFTDEAAAGRLVGGGLTIKAILSAAAMIAIGLLVAVQPVGNKAALMLVGLSMVLTTGLEYLAYCFRALRRLQNEAFANVLGRVVNLLLGLGLLFAGGGVWGLAVAGNVAIIVALVFSYRQLSRFVRPVWRPDWLYWRRYAWQPTAMGLGIVFSIISFRLDNLLIAPMLDRAALGKYNAAYRLFEPSLIVPSVILAAAFPLLSQAAASRSRDSRNEGHFREVLGNTILVLFGLGAFASASIFFLAPPVVGWLGSDYAASGPLLQLLALACLPMYLNYGLTHALIATNRPQVYATFTFVSMVVNLGANLILIPTIGLPGAAVATIMSEGALLVLCGAAMTRAVFGPQDKPATSLADLRSPSKFKVDSEPYGTLNLEPGTKLEPVYLVVPHSGNGHHSAAKPVPIEVVHEHSAEGA